VLTNLVSLLRCQAIQQQQHRRGHVTAQMRFLLDSTAYDLVETLPGRRVCVLVHVYVCMCIYVCVCVCMYVYMIWSRRFQDGACVS
jgi:hypothetical protein